MAEMGIGDFDELEEVEGEKVSDEFTLQEIIEKVMEELKRFKLSERAKAIIREFLIFHWNRKKYKSERPEIVQTYYNLLFRSDDKEMPQQIVEVLGKYLNINTGYGTFYSEEFLRMKYDLAKRGRREENFRRDILEGKKLLFVYDCKEAPVQDPDLPTAAARDNNLKEIEYYHGMWKEILKYVKENTDIILIVSANEQVYRDSLKLNTELFYRVCGHHIFLSKQTEKGFYEGCLDKLINTNFTLEVGFEEALGQYFSIVYPKAELKGQEFVDDLIRRIYALYFCKERENYMLTTDCIPKYNMQAVSAEDILGEMDELIGLENVKKEFRNLYKAQLTGMNNQVKQRYHMLFTGNPGTGKTTVARLTADLLYHMNIIKSNKLIVTKASDFISPWKDGTGMKTKEAIRKAYGGVLFIDEAYGFIGNGSGADALNILIQEMEEKSDKLVVIFAGYKDEMRDLMKMNPGLSSRIYKEILFEDYSEKELIEIFHFHCKKAGFSMDVSAQSNLEECIRAEMTREYFGNAREIEKMIQRLKEAWSEEYYEYVKNNIESTMTKEKVFHIRHFEKIMPPKKEISINELVGLSTMKDKLEMFRKQAAYQKYLREKGVVISDNFSMHMIFTGNPGTGKTTVAKLIADDLYSIGILKTNRLVEVERKDLVSPYPGQTAVKTADVVKKAVGGVLFVDEAYTLAGDSNGLGREAIEVLLTAMEEHKSDTVFVFAGYMAQMHEFLAMNPGIQSRIGYTFHFADYSTEELTLIFEKKMVSAGFELAEGVLEKVENIMEYFRGIDNFGNGRFVNHVIQQIISQRAFREFANDYREITVADIPSMKDLIATAPNSMKLYDPAEITTEDKRRTAFHEIGHAIVLYVTDQENVPESISIRNQAGTFGRVRISVNRAHNHTEQELLNEIAVLLAGKNAEKVVLGDHSTGCSSDYARAKRIAEDMIDNYAMVSFGETPLEIVRKADDLSISILESKKEDLLSIAEALLEKKEMSGAEFVRMLDFSAREGNDNER